MTLYIKEPHTVIFTGPTGCGKSHLVLDLIEKNAADILTTSFLSAHHNDWIRHIMLKPGSCMMVRFGW